MPKLGDDLNVNGFQVKNLADPTLVDDAANKGYVDDKAGYTHTQAIPNNIWTINHNLGYHPNVTVVDSAEEKVEGDLQFVDANNLTLTFSGAFSGKAYLS